MSLAGCRGLAVDPGCVRLRSLKIKNLQTHLATVDLHRVTCLWDLVQEPVEVLGCLGCTSVPPWLGPVQW